MIHDPWICYPGVVEGAPALFALGSGVPAERVPGSATLQHGQMSPGRMGELATQPSVTAESFGMSEGCAIREDGREPSASWASEAAARTARHDVLDRSGPHTVEDSCSGEACSLSRTLANTQSEEQGAQQQQHSGRKRGAVTAVSRHYCCRHELGS